jgi:hypothetical protein
MWRDNMENGHYLKAVILLIISCLVSNAVGNTAYPDSINNSTNESNPTVFERDSVIDFMERYLIAYSTIAQDPKTTHQMYEFYPPDLTVIIYVDPVDICNREEMLAATSTHPDIQETLTPQQFIIDEAQGMVAALIQCNLTDKATGELLRQMNFSGHYQLKFDEEENLKIKNLWLFAQYPPSGEESIFEMYQEDRQKTLGKVEGNNSVQ